MQSSNHAKVVNRGETRPGGISRRAGVIRASACTVILVAALACGCSVLEPGVAVVVEPYADVNWATFEQHKGNLHTHTTQSDGRLTPDQVIDAYHQRGYTVLALTDHNLCTWPWVGAADMPRRGNAARADKEAQEKQQPPAVPAYQNRDPAGMGMLAISGNELSRHDHMGCFFIVHESDSRDVEQSLAEVKASAGLAVLYHPGRYWKPTEQGGVPAEVVERYVTRFTRNDHLVGFEVINQGNKYPHDRALWDAVLTSTMPDRPVWGFANDDMHSSGSIGRDWSTFVVVQLDESHIRQAMQQGQFYFSTVGTHDEAVRDVAQTPVIASITHRRGAGTITIAATSGGQDLPESQYRWISQGQVVHSGPVLDYRNTEGLGNYVRAELVGTGGTTFTNPIGLQHPRKQQKGEPHPTSR